jgi:predicted alpha/beta-hydrolase family hydrolase
MLQSVSHGLVRGVLHLPENASGDAIVLTHGAGSNCQAPLLVALAEVFSQAGMAALRCDLAFRQKRPHGPPMRGSSEQDQQSLREAVRYLRTETGGRVFLGGHSYGGRQASIAAAGDAELASGLLLLSYPLHPPKRPAELRTAHFREIRTRTFFVHGSRDEFATHEELREAMQLISAGTEVLEVASVGHELMSKRNAAELPLAIARGFVAWMGA